MLKKLKLLFLDTSLFRVSYIMFLFFSMVMYIEKVAIWVQYGLFVWGFFLSLYSVIVRKSFKRLYFGIWLMAFLLSFTLTIVFNISSNLTALLYNIGMLINVSICFFVFYGMYLEKGVPFRWELYLTARLIVYLATLFTLIGLILMLFTHGRYDAYMYYKGEVFKGFFTNPNYQGYASAISIIFCHMLTKPNFVVNSGQKRVSRIILVSCVVLNMIALLLCDSTASLVLLVVYAAVFVIIKLFSMIEELTVKKMLSRVAMLIVAGVVMVALMIFMRTSFRLGVVSLFSGEGGVDPEIYNKISSQGAFKFLEDSGFTSRVSLWQSGIKVFLSNPILGVGKGNLYDCMIAAGCKSPCPTFYGKYDRILFSDLHNGYLMILVTAGIIGFLLFMTFIVRVLRMTVPVWFVHRRIMMYSAYPCLLAFMFAYFVYALVEKTILFDVSFLVISFWTVLGYLACYAIDFGYDRRGRTKFKVFGKSIRKRLY
ncbi:MAG: O-antigen ligase family protein [Ruminococcus sp.]